MKARPRWVAVIGLALLHTPGNATSAPKETPTSANVQQSGGVHDGDNVIGDQTKVIVQGNATIVLPSTATGTAPSSATQKQHPAKRKAAAKPTKPAREPPEPTELVAKFITDRCILQPVARRSQMFADISFDFGMSMKDFVRIPNDEPPIYRKFTGPRPINTAGITQGVSPSEFDREVHCEEYVKEDCLEYDLIDIVNQRDLKREWASEWEDQVRKGLLQDPERVAQIVGCFSEEDVSLEGDSAQLWTLRLESLAGQLEQRESIVQVGASLHQSLLRDVLIRWAHLLILRSTREPLEGAHRKAGELFARAAALTPTERWLHKAAADELARDGAYEQASDEQVKLIALLSNQPGEKPAPRTMSSDVLLATINLIEWRLSARQFDQALKELNALRTRLDSSDQMHAALRHKFQALADVLTGDAFAAQSQWDTASQYYEAAATYRPDEPSSDGDPMIFPDPVLEPQQWLLHAGMLSHLAENRDRSATLDQKIRSTVPYFRDESQQPTWETWRYLQARWWSSLRLRDRSTADLSRIEADRTLERLLQQPVRIDLSQTEPREGPSDSSTQPDRVPPLDGLSAARGFSGGVFPASNYVQSQTEIQPAATALLYRSIVEHLARASRADSEARIADAQTSYVMASELAAELTNRLPHSGAFLEIAVLRDEGRFLQSHHLNPVRALQLTERADALLVTTTCDESVRNAYRNSPKLLVASMHAFQKQTYLGAVPLVCPFALIKAAPLDGKSAQDRPAK